MAETQETTDDIIAEVRDNRGFPVPYSPEGFRAIWLTDVMGYVDRLEAAHEREIAAGGNAAALREALSDACYAMFDFLKTQDGPCYREMAEALDKGKAALALPRRNCGVGTVEEQLVRFNCQCFRHHTGRCSRNCKFLPIEATAECALKWAQMPYEADAERGGARRAE